jgi:hypothetical protein
MLNRTTAFQIVSMLMAATIHGQIYTSRCHFIVIDMTNLPFAPEMGALTSRFFIHSPRMAEAGTFPRSESP